MFYQVPYCASFEIIDMDDVAPKNTYYIKERKYDTCYRNVKKKTKN